MLTSLERPRVVLRPAPRQGFRFASIRRRRRSPVAAESERGDHTVSTQIGTRTMRAAQFTRRSARASEGVSLHRVVNGDSRRAAAEGGAEHLPNATSAGARAASASDAETRPLPVRRSPRVLLIDLIDVRELRLRSKEVHRIRIDTPICESSRVPYNTLYVYCIRVHLKMR